MSIHPGMILGSSEYPRNPRILRQGGGGGSCVHPRIVQVSQKSQDTQTGGGGVSCVHPGMIPGSSKYPRNPRILRQGGVELCPSRDDPRIVQVSQESQDTQTGGMIPGSSKYHRNPRILRQGGGGVSCVHPEMIPGSSEYPRNPGILRQGGGRAVSIPG